MKKLLIVGCILVLCCCVSTFAGFAAIGYFELNGKCAYRGPFAPADAGICSTNAINTTNTTNTTSNSTSNTTTNSTGTTQTSDNQVYTGYDYSLEYPEGFMVDDADSDILFVYAENLLDNLNISKRSYTIVPSQNECVDLGNSTIDELATYDSILEDVSVVTLDGYKACRLEFTADYGTESGRVNQTQYYIAVGSETYFETITINLDGSNYATLDRIANSIQFN